MDRQTVLEWLNSLKFTRKQTKEKEIVEYLKTVVKGKKAPHYAECAGACFEKLWQTYPRKVAKQNAKKMYMRKIRNLNDEEVKAVSREIYRRVLIRKQYWEEHETEQQFIPHFATFLNAEFEDR